MLLIASEADIDVQAIITHTIHGLNGPAHIKSPMYEATSLREFKKKLIAYEIQMHDSPSNEKPSSLRCSNCGEFHKNRECPHKDKGPRCFRCNLFGHRSNRCPSQEGNKTSPTINTIQSINEREEEEHEATPKEDEEFSRFHALQTLYRLQKQREKENFL